MKDMVTFVNNLLEKTGRLVEKHQKTLSENEQLSLEVLKLKEELTQRNQQIAALEDNLKLLKLAKSVDNESTKDVKLKINEMVREIDKCIAKISR
jgi:regulator of replication initiation timing